jgi:hypothetical protein
MYSIVYKIKNMGNTLVLCCTASDEDLNDKKYKKKKVSINPFTNPFTTDSTITTRNSTVITRDFKDNNATDFSPSSV